MRRGGAIKTESDRPLPVHRMGGMVVTLYSSNRERLLEARRSVREGALTATPSATKRSLAVSIKLEAAPQK